MERSEHGGLSLIEAGLLRCLLGIVLAVAVPTFLGNVRTSKISEAAEQLETLHRSTAAYFATERGKLRHCLPPKAGPTPVEPSPALQRVDFADPTSAGHGSWLALDFQPKVPIRYRYTYAPRSHGCALVGSDASVLYRAEGDLDGDGVFSLFERRATVTEGGALVPVGVLYVERRVD